MGILGHGCDVVMVTRILEIFKRRGVHRLASRILSRAEISDWQLQLSCSQTQEDTENARFLAVRYATTHLLSLKVPMEFPQVGS